MSALVHNLYNEETIGQWQHEKTMMHSSGIWGRQPVLKYLRERVLRRGNIVVDLGAGAGCPSLQISACVGSAGRVIGIDLSEAMVAADAPREEIAISTTLQSYNAAHICMGCHSPMPGAMSGK